MQNKNKSDVLDAVKDLIEQLREDYHIDSVYLFGSYSYGIPNSDSDIDIAVILDENVNDDVDFDIFVKAQRFDLDMETVSFAKKDFDNDSSDLIVEIKNKGEKVA